MSVYGPAQTKPKQAFLAELAHLCLKETLPMIIGDDFNIIRGPVEKNNNNYDDRWPFLFNAVIDACNLRELELSGRRFTWTNHRTIKTFEKLDRTLTSTDWELKYPRSTVQALNREILDHTLFSLTQEIHLRQEACHCLSLSLGGLCVMDSLTDMVKDIWSYTNFGQTPLERWQNKIHRLRQHLS